MADRQVTERTEQSRTEYFETRSISCAETERVAVVLVPVLQYTEHR